MVVPTVGISGIDQALEWAIEYPNNLDLQAEYRLTAATNTGGLSFNAIVDGNNWNYVP